MEKSHEDVWLARDGLWRCVLCEPFWFAGEVVGRSTVEELLSQPIGEYVRGKAA